MIEVKVPVLAESIPDALVLEWRKRAGESVEKDEILMDMMPPAPESEREGD